LGSTIDNTLVIFTSDNGGHPEFAFNRPFRGSKWNLYEGGIRVPMIVRWPNKIKQGIECSVPVIQTDFMPTFYELSSGKQKDFNDHWDGTSMLPVFNNPNDDFNYNRSFVWHFPYYVPEGVSYFKAPNEIGIEDGYISKTVPQSAIRNGKYKLLYFYEDDKVELYDIEKDFKESNDISDFRPWITDSLKRELFKYLDKVNARYARKNINQ
jgi:arylsulfatase A-like enzyme